MVDFSRIVEVIFATAVDVVTAGPVVPVVLVEGTNRTVPAPIATMNIAPATTASITMGLRLSALTLYTSITEVPTA